MRHLHRTLSAIENDMGRLYSETDSIVFEDGKINGCMAANYVYNAFASFVLHQANILDEVEKKPGKKHTGTIWVNLNAPGSKNLPLKKFQVKWEPGGKLSLTAKLVQLKPGIDPFDQLTNVACCGGHCSSGSYDICPTYE